MTRAVAHGDGGYKSTIDVWLGGGTGNGEVWVWIAVGRGPKPSVGGLRGRTGGIGVLMMGR
jgi:hypothetical protein